MRTIKTLKRVRIETPNHVPQIDLSEFDDDGEPFEALRLCYYTVDGRYPNRPLFIQNDDFIKLLIKAFKEKLFTDEERQKLINELSKILSDPENAEDLLGRYSGDVSEKDFEEIKHSIHDQEIRRKDG